MGNRGIEMFDPQILGHNLQKLREAAGFESQAEFCRAHNLERQVYRMHENGLRAPKLDQVVIYANIFGVSIDQLIEYSAAEKAILSCFQVSVDWTTGPLKKLKHGAPDLPSGAEHIISRMGGFFCKVSDPDELSGEFSALCVPANTARTHGMRPLGVIVSEGTGKNARHRYFKVPSVPAVVHVDQDFDVDGVAVMLIDR